ncbi:uncharacterized protein [Eurosta solidaginis]|uniref:uncharacterized protein n=1 Tax=Eurosta solidaginis TaxID=178769 RepID=UPI003530F84C
MYSKRHWRRLIKQEKESNFDLRVGEETVTEEIRGTVAGEISAVAAPELVQVEENNEHHLRLPLEEKLTLWAGKHSETRMCFDDILEIFRSEGFSLPKSSKTLMKIEKAPLRPVAPGSSYLLLDINIDGAPLFKSNNASLWPILGKVVGDTNKNVFTIGVFLGNKKPFNVSCYLHDFILEMQALKDVGFSIGGKQFFVSVKCFICDAPARAYVYGTVGFNARNGCSNCIQTGTRVNNTTIFNTAVAQPRSDEDFKLRRYGNYHKPMLDSCLSLETIGIKMVTQFPLEPMHLVDLGIVKKMLKALLEGQTKNFKLRPESKNSISSRFLSFVPYIPDEFARKPRSLVELRRWKATEFRQFVLYTGIVALKDVVPEEYYYNFCLLHCSYRLLSVKETYQDNLEVATDMIKHFIELFPDIYHENLVSYNVHSLLHLTQCVQETGFINSFSAYPFENCMRKLKRYVKNPSKILEQIYNKVTREVFQIKMEEITKKRLNKYEKVIGIQTPTYLLNLKPKNKYCLLKTGTAIAIQSFGPDGQVLYGNNC